jgi:hypothetical protein
LLHAKRPTGTVQVGFGWWPESKQLTGPGSQISNRYFTVEFGGASMSTAFAHRLGVRVGAE